MTQFARPASDITTTGWQTAPLYSKLNDSSDATVVRNNNGVTTQCEVKLGAVTDPAVSTGHDIHIHAQATGSGAGEKFSADLYQGSTFITRFQTNQLADRAAQTDYAYTLTGAEADSITDYSDLRFRIWMTTGGASEFIEFAEAWLEVPDVPPTDLVVQDAGLALAADNIDLTQVHAIAVQDAALALAADNVVLEEIAAGVTLVIQDAAHALAADNLATVQRTHYTWSDSDTATPPSSSSTDLVVQDAALGLAAENLALTQVHNLAIQDAAHGLTADNLALVQQHTLVIQDAAHGLTAENLALTQVHNLAVADAALALAAENVSLAPPIDLVVQDASLALAADNVAETQEHHLVVQDAALGLTAENLLLTQVHSLAVQDAALALAAESPTLIQQHTLAVQDAALAQAADNVVLSETSAVDLVIQDAALALAADSLTLTQAHILVIGDAALACSAGKPGVSNVHFDANVTGWNPNSGVSIAWDGTEGHEALGSNKVTKTGSNAFTYVAAVTACLVGETIRASAWVKGNGTDPVYLSVYWYENNQWKGTTNYLGPTSSSWQYVSFDFVVPVLSVDPNGYRLALGYGDAAANGQIFWVDDATASGDVVLGQVHSLAMQDALLALSSDTLGLTGDDVAPVIHQDFVRFRRKIFPFVSR